MLRRRVWVFVVAVVLIFTGVTAAWTTAAAKEISRPTSLVVEPSSLNLKVGEGYTLKALLTFSDGTVIDATKNGVWTVNDRRVANINRGRVIALAPGNVLIQVRSYGLTGSVNVTVTASKSVQNNSPVNPRQNMSGPVVNAPVRNAGSPPAVTNRGGSVPTPAVSSSERSSAGQTPPAAPKPRVEVPRPVSLVIDPLEMALDVGQNREFAATLTFSDGSVKDAARNAVFTITNDKVVSVRNGKITALSPGSATVILKSYDLSGQIQVTVREPKMANIPKPLNIEVQSESLTLKVGQSATFGATVHFSDGKLIDATHNGVWHVADSKIAAIRPGVVTGLAPGETVITVRSYGLTDQIKVVVESQPDETVTEEPKDPVPEEPSPITDETVIEEPEDPVSGEPSPITDETVIEEPEDPMSGEPSPITEEPAPPGLPDGQVPSVEVSGSALQKSFRWSYQNKTYTWDVEVPRDLIAWSDEVYETTKAFFEATSYARGVMLSKMTPEMQKLVLAFFGNSEDMPRDPAAMVQDSRSNVYAKKLAEALKERAEADGYDRFETAEFVLKFAQSVPYEMEEYPELPAGVLKDSGDCDGKSVLLATILRNMGYDVALFYYSAQDIREDISHIAVGVSFSREEIPIRSYQVAYWPNSGRNYYIADPGFPSLGLGQRNGYKVTKIYPIH